MTAPNVTVIQSTDEQAILAVIKAAGATGIHATNGTYMYGHGRVVPTTLAGFQFITDSATETTSSLLIAVNSDISMNDIMNKKSAPQGERDALEGQAIRAEKVWSPLAAQFPDRKIIIAFYDRSTPNSLYEMLAADSALQLLTLHKWGYGTDPSIPKIEGAELFARTYGFPTPNDIKPVCYDITRMENQSSIVGVKDLRTVIGRHGEPYITSEGVLLFSLADSLKKYGPVSTIHSASLKLAP